MQGFNITAVERDTGLSKDLLRMWERRYGFPAPQRDQHGERVYSVADVERASSALEEIAQSAGVISEMSLQIATAAEEQTSVTEEITLKATFSTLA